MERMMNNLRRRENGQIAILLVMVLPVVFLLLALPLDAGIWYFDHRMAQNQVDAAALAGVQHLPAADTTLATDAVHLWLEKNGSGQAELACLDYSDRFPAGDLDLRADTLEVCIRRKSPSVFAGLAGLDYIWVSASATVTAVINASVPVDANFITLNPTACGSLVVNANGNFVVEGPILVNSECNAYAAEFGCNLSCEAQGGIFSTGPVTQDAGCNPCDVTAIPHFDDPLRDLLPPCYLGSAAPCQNVDEQGNSVVGPLGISMPIRHGSPSFPELLQVSSGVLNPGVYYGGLDISGGSMAPGIYIMAGGGFKVNTSDQFDAPGVFIYNTNDPACPACGNGGFREVIINTNAGADFSPMNAGPYAGMLFFQDRANTMKAVFNSNGLLGEGTIYFSSAHVDLNPNQDVTFQIIADTIKVNNNGDFVARFTGSNFFEPIEEIGIALIQ